MFSVPLGTPTAEQIKLIQKIQVYPNPVATGESLMVEFIADKQDLPLQVEIINIVGQSFEKRKLIPGGAIDLKTDAISPGLYFIRFQQENVTVVKKVIIQ
jgi:hypothetical protein